MCLPDEFHFHEQMHWHQQQLYVVVRSVHYALVPRIVRAFVPEIQSSEKCIRDQKENEQDKKWLLYHFARQSDMSRIDSSIETI